VVTRYCQDCLKSLWFAVQSLNKIMLRVNTKNCSCYCLEEIRWALQIKQKRKSNAAVDCWFYFGPYRSTRLKSFSKIKGMPTLVWKIKGNIHFACFLSCPIRLSAFTRFPHCPAESFPKSFTVRKCNNGLTFAEAGSIVGKWFYFARQFFQNVWVKTLRRSVLPE